MSLLDLVPKHAIVSLPGPYTEQSLHHWLVRLLRRSLPTHALSEFFTKLQTEEFNKFLVLDKGVLLSHLRLQTLSEPRATILILEQEYKLPPLWKAEVVISLASPESRPDLHLEALSLLMETFSSGEWPSYFPPRPLRFHPSALPKIFSHTPETIE